MTERHMGGWVRTQPDPRNQQYRIADEPVMAQAIHTRQWQPGPITDQGQTPECVAYGSDDFLTCAPILNQPIPQDALYAACQAVDGIRGAHDGTTVHAAMKVLKARGLVSAYLWANTEAEVRAWVANKGPVVIGIDWPETFFTPTKAGYLNYPAGAQIAGGHCVLLCGYDTKRGAYRVQNSWGAAWGQGGFAWLRRGVLAQLLSDGEAATATEVAA